MKFLRTIWFVLVVPRVVYSFAQPAATTVDKQPPHACDVQMLSVDIRRASGEDPVRPGNEASGFAVPSLQNENAVDALR